MRLSGLLLLLLCCCCYNTTFAQENNRFTAYTVNDGLAQSTVESVIQDKDGFLWFGTEGGISRFDGYNFKTYRHSATDPHSIIGDKSIRFYIDKNNCFWVLTYNGLSIYNANRDNFNCLLQIEPHSVFTASNNFLGEDERYIYAGICEYGVMRINKKTHLVSKINIPGINIVNDASSWYHGFLEGDKLWIVANQQFVIYNLLTKQTKLLNAHLNTVANINAHLALGVSSREVTLIDKQSLNITSYNLTENGTEPNLGTILRLSDTAALLGSPRNGIYYFNTVTKKVTKHFTDLGDEQRQPISADCLYNDHSGNFG